MGRLLWIRYGAVPSIVALTLGIYAVIAAVGQALFGSGVLAAASATVAVALLGFAIRSAATSPED